MIKLSDPFENLKSNANNEFDPNQFESAISAFDQNKPEKLIEILSSNDNQIALNGLFVFSELGKRGKILREHVLKFLQYNSIEFHEYVISGYLSYIEELNPQELSAILNTIKTSNKTTREYIILILSKVDANKLEHAVTLLENQDDFPYHSRGVTLIKQNASFIDVIEKREHLPSLYNCYFYASLLRAANSAENFNIESFHDGTSDFDFIVYIVKKRL